MPKRNHKKQDGAGLFSCVKGKTASPCNDRQSAYRIPATTIARAQEASTVARTVQRQQREEARAARTAQRHAEAEARKAEFRRQEAALLLQRRTQRLETLKANIPKFYKNLLVTAPDLTPEKRFAKAKEMAESFYDGETNVKVTELRLKQVNNIINKTTFTITEGGSRHQRKSNTVARKTTRKQK